MATDSATLQSLITRYNKIKDNVCGTDSDCALNKKLLELEIDFKKAELGLETGENKKWLAEREIIQLTKGNGELRKHINIMTQSFSDNLEKTFNEIINNLTTKANGIQNQKAFLIHMNEMINFYNIKHDGIKRKYDKVINKNSINKRLAFFYDADEEYIKPFMNLLEKVYWPVLILTTIMLLFKIFRGKYPTMNEKIVPVFSLVFLYILPFVFRTFASSFQPYEYKEYEYNDVDDPKRYKNLAE